MKGKAVNGSIQRLYHLPAKYGEMFLLSACFRQSASPTAPSVYIS